jgi:hypothetical protein
MGLLPIRSASLLTLIAFLAAGCGSHKDAGNKEEVPRNPLLGRPEAGAGGIRRTVDRIKVQNDLKQLHTHYATYLTETGRAPKSLDEFKEYIKREPGKLYQELSDGYYELHLTRSLSSNVVLANEKAPDAAGLHMVVRGDGSIANMTTAELQKALKVVN